jgi:hypothetical protein
VEIHEEVTGQARGRRHGYDALNRSAIILAVAAWEGFCEDIALQSSDLMAKRLRRRSHLPDSVRHPMLQWMHDAGDWSKLSRETRDAVWSLAGPGWRHVYRDYAVEKTKALNTPNHQKIRVLLSVTIGLSDFSSNWGSQRWPRDTYISRLNDLLDLRHRIAHGDIGAETVGKTKARNAIALIEQLAAWVDARVADHLQGLNLSPIRLRAPFR